MYAARSAAAWDAGVNPLAGVAAAAFAVDAACGQPCVPERSASLWNAADPGMEAPAFCKVFLPASAWMRRLGNLGQAYFSVCSLLHHADPVDVALILQYADRVGPQSWDTSVLVHDHADGDLNVERHESAIPSANPHS